MNEDPSVLRVLERRGQAAARVALRGTVRDAKARDRYEIVGELARGAVGLVHHGRDHDVGRDVALKVIRDEHLDDPELIRRFIEEAQIGGQLQHPGIVPVYELGLTRNDRPFFAMKLVKGETLAARLARRTRPSEDRSKMLAAFRDVCRTVAYAHARGVIHRDLKPTNVMIGNFGEVQVVDWGFAKVLRQGGIDDEALAKKAQRDVTMISTIRSGDRSIAGSILGTPAYMPPEQALGRVDDLDEKSDLFSLGAMLCEILTGTPPYSSRSGAERVDAAARADLGPALARLEECDANPKLIDLCRACLEPLPMDRPGSAEVVADRVAEHLTASARRAHRARLRAIEAADHAEEQRRSKRFTRVVGTSVVVAILVALGAFLSVDADRTTRERERRAAIAAALEDATHLRAQGLYEDALVAAQRAKELGHDGPLADEIRAEAAAAERVATRRAEEERLLRDLEKARAMRADHGDKNLIDAAYVSAVAALWPGGDVDAQRLRASEHRNEFAAAFDDWAHFRRRLVEHEDWRAIDAVARAIDPAANEFRDAMATDDRPTMLRLLDEAHVPSMPPQRIAVIGAALLDAGATEAAISFLRPARRRHPGDFWIALRLGTAAEKTKDFELAIDCQMSALALRPDSVEARHHLGIALESSGNLDAAIRVWRDALERDDQWAHGHSHIAEALWDAGRRDEAIESCRAALARHPKSAELHLTLGAFLAVRSEHDEAIAELDRAIALDDASAPAYFWKGRVLLARRDAKAAEAAFRDALEREGTTEATARLAESLRMQQRFVDARSLLDEALRNDPDDAELLAEFGGLRLSQGDPKGAVEYLERAIAAGGTMHAHCDLGAALHSLGLFEPALEALQTGYGQFDGCATNNFNLGVVYRDLERPRLAIRHFSDAIDLGCHLLAPAHAQIGLLRRKLGERRDAIASFEAATKIDPNEAWYRALLGDAYRANGDWNEAVDAFAAAVRLDRDHTPYLEALAACHLARSATDEGRPDDLDRAIEHFRAVTERDPTITIAHARLGQALIWAEEFKAAVAPLRTALEREDLVRAGKAVVRRELVIAFARTRRPDEARAELSVAVTEDPENWRELLRIARQLRDATGKGPAAVIVDALRAARAIRPALAVGVELGFALIKAGRHEEAIEEFGRLSPSTEPRTQAWIRYGIGTAHFMLHQFEQAVTELEAAIAIQPEFPNALCNLGLCLDALGRWADAVERLREGHRLGSLQKDWPSPSAEWLADAEEKLALVPKLEAVIGGRAIEATPRERAIVASMLHARGRHAASVRFFGEAFRSDPELAKEEQRLIDAIIAAGAGGSTERAPALEWLSALVALLRSRLDADPEGVVGWIDRMLTDPGLAPVRDGDRRSAAWSKLEALREEAASAAEK